MRGTVNTYRIRNVTSYDEGRERTMCVTCMSPEAGGRSHPEVVDASIPGVPWYMYTHNNNNTPVTHCTLHSPQHTINISVTDQQAVLPPELDIFSTELCNLYFLFLLPIL